MLNKTVGLLLRPLLLTFCFLILTSSSVLYSLQLWIFILGNEHFISRSWHQKAESVFRKSTDSAYTCNFPVVRPPPPNKNNSLITGNEPDLLQAEKYKPIA